MTQGSIKILLGFISLFVVVLFGLHENLHFEPSLASAVTVLGILFLESKAPSHKVYGFSPTTFPLYIYLALIPQGSVGAAMALAVIAIFLREVLALGRANSIKFWEFMVDTLAVCGGLASLKTFFEFGPKWNEVPVVAVVAAAFCYFLLRPVLQNAWLAEMSLEQRQSWEEDQVNATPLVSLVAFLAIPYGFLSSFDSGVALFLPAAPFLLSAAIVPLLDPTKDPNRIRLSQSLNPMGSVAAPTTVSHSSETALDLSQDDFSFLQKLADSLTHQPTVERVLEEVMWLARRLTSCDSVVLFLHKDDEWSVWKESKTSHKEALSKAISEGHMEPLVARALRTNRADFLRQEDDEEGRIFEDETTAVAVPMHNSGVIYLGRVEEEMFSDDEIDRLTVLGQEAHLALRLARASEASQALVVGEAEARREVDYYRRGMREIVDLVRELMPLETREQIIEKAGLGLSRLMTHDYWAINFGVSDQWPPPYHVLGPPSKPKTDDSAVRTIVNRIRRRSMSIIENDMKESELPQPSKGTRSMLGAPLYSHGHCGGSILVFSSKSNAFNENDLDLLNLVAQQLGALLTVAGEDPELDALRTQLVQSSKMAAVGQLAAGVAHELNTPLGALMLDLEGSYKSLESRPDKTKKRLERALRSGSQLKKIAARLLFYARESVVEEEETDLNQVVHETVEVMEHQLNLDDIELTCELGELDLVLAHRNELQQIVLNLLTNAKDAVLAQPNGGPRHIKISTSNHPRAVELAVQDTGVGIGEAEQAKVFRAFYTTKEAGEGTGLGLSVTKELVEKHGGAIRVQSELGKGARFVLRLPKA